MISPSASSRKMPPTVVVACNVPTARSRAPLPPLAPIALPAVRISVPSVVISTVALSPSSSIVDVLISVMLLLSPETNAVTTIAPPRIVTGSLNVTVSMVTAPVPSDRPMVIKVNVGAIAFRSAAIRSSMALDPLSATSTLIA